MKIPRYYCAAGRLLCQKFMKFVHEQPKTRSLQYQNAPTKFGENPLFTQVIVKKEKYRHMVGR